MRIAYSYLKRVMAGAVFGLYMAYLLYFLNPQLELSPGRILVAIFVYALICGVLFGSFLWAFRWVRVRLFGRGDSAARRHGFGVVTASAFLATVVFWMHALLLDIYLPRGAVRVLSKATILIAATSLILFILWLLERNAGSRAARALFFAGLGVVALSAFLLYQRREGYRATAQEAVYAELGTLPGQRPVVFVAVRNLPYDWLVTLVGEGRLPNLQRLTGSSYFARVEPFRTSSPKAIWASLATGQLPHRHGVTGRFSYRTLLNRGEGRITLVPSGVGFRAWGLLPPVERISAQLPAGESLPFWSFFQRVGFPSAVVNWNGTYPARSEGTAVISDRFLRTGETALAIFPVALKGEALRWQRAAEPGGKLALALKRSGRRRAARLQGAADADAAAIAAAKGLLVSRRPSLLAISLNALGDAVDGIELTDQALPPQGSVDGDIIRAEIEEIDRQVGELAAANRDAALVVVSPMAIAPPPFPISVAAILDIAGERADPGRDDGFVIFSGGPFVHRANPAGAEVADVVPTLLFASGLPVARDLDGRILTEAFDEGFLRENPLAVIPTYRASRLDVRR